VNETFTARISADEGTTLYYLCALHPWMQGSIDVVALLEDGQEAVAQQPGKLEGRFRKQEIDLNNREAWELPRASLFSMRRRDSWEC
jgi:hypothetical protein